MSAPARALHQALSELAGDDASLVHPTYGYLQRRVRLAGLTWLQWTQLLVSLLSAYVLAQILPVPEPYDLSVALTVSGLPVAWTLVATDARVDPWQRVRSYLSWRRTRGIYLPGPDPLHPPPPGRPARDPEQVSSSPTASTQGPPRWR